MRPPVPARPEAWIDRQHRCPLEKRRRRSQTAACARPARGALQLGGDVLVRSRRWPGRDATHADRGRCPDRSRRPVRGAPTVFLGQTRIRRPPSAPADDGTAPGRRTAPVPLRLPVPRASVPMPNRAAARHNSAGSPSGSAAASSSSQRVCSGRACSLTPEALFNRGRQRRGAMQFEPAGQFMARRNRAATRATPAGYPPSRQRCGREPARPAARSAPSPAVPAHPPLAGRRSPLFGRRLRSGCGTRVAMIMPTDSAPSRRATNASTCAEVRSSQCRSSMRKTSGCCSASRGKEAQCGQPDQEAVRAAARRVDRMRYPRHHAEATEDARGDPAWAHTPGAARRTEAPSPIRHRRHGPNDSPALDGRRTPSTPTSRRPGRHAESALGSWRPARPAAPRRAGCVQRGDQSAPSHTDGRTTCWPAGTYGRLRSTEARDALRVDGTHMNHASTLARPSEPAERLDNLESGLLMSRLCDCPQESNGRCTSC